MGRRRRRRPLRGQRAVDRSWRLLVVAAQVARQDAQLLAILRDRAARDVDPLLLEAADDLLVAARGPPVLGRDQVGYHLLDARVGDRGAAVVLVARGEEVLELEDAVGRADVLV